MATCAPRCHPASLRPTTADAFGGARGSDANELAAVIRLMGGRVTNEQARRKPRRRSPPLPQPLATASLPRPPAPPAAHARTPPGPSITAGCGL